MGEKKPPAGPHAPESVRVAVQCISPDARILRELSTAVARSIRSAAISRYPRYPAPGTAPPAGLAIVDVSSDPVAALAVLSAGAERPASASIAVLQEKDAGLMLASLRNGAADLLVPPITDEQMTAAVSRLKLRRPDAFTGAVSARVLAFVPAPGGSGATTLAQSVAFAWKRRFPSARVLIADFDALTGIQGFLLKLKSQYNFLDVLRRADTIDADLWKGTVVSRSGIDLLLAPEPGTPFGVQVPDTNPVLEYARQNYDVVILDTGRPYGRWPLGHITAADRVFLVSVPEAAGLYSARRALRYLETAGIQHEGLRLIVNRVDRKTGFVIERLPDGLQVRLEPFYSDAAVRRAVMDGKPVPVGSSLSKQCSQLVEDLSGIDLNAAHSLFERVLEKLRRRPPRGKEAQPLILKVGPGKGTS